MGYEQTFWRLQWNLGLDYRESVGQSVWQLLKNWSWHGRWGFPTSDWMSEPGVYPWRLQGQRISVEEDWVRWQIRIPNGNCGGIIDGRDLKAICLRHERSRSCRCSCLFVDCCKGNKKWLRQVCPLVTDSQSMGQKGMDRGLVRCVKTLDWHLQVLSKLL